MASTSGGTLPLAGPSTPPSVVRPRAASSPKLAPNEHAVRAAALAAQQEADDSPTCWICAEPVAIYAVGPCNHRTCHVCSLRLRALYKKMECTFCKTALDHVIFTASPDTPFEAYPPDSTPYKDDKLGISFETREQQEDTMALLHFNCPDPACGEVCGGWGDLRRHIKRDHSRVLCDLCTRNQKIFAHEHTLFTQAQLKGHIEQGEKAFNRPATSTATPSGFTGHPVCDFCRVHYYDSDELFKHCREKHEQCFICVRNGSGRHDYYVDWPALDRHFNERHYACDNSHCKVDKFVVFETMLDLQAHQVEKHGADASKQARKEARRIEINITHADSSRTMPPRRQEETAPPRRRDEPSSRPTFVSMNGSNLAPGRTVPGLGPQRKPHHEANAGPSTPRAISPRPAPDTEAEKHDALLNQVKALVAHSDSKVASFKAAVRSYRNSETAASDLLDTLYAIFDHRMSAIEEIVRGLAELFDTPGKKADLLGAWKDFDIDQDAFPTLTPIGPTLNNQPTRKSVASVVKPAMPKASGSRRVPGMASVVVRNGHSTAAVLARVQAAAANEYPALPSPAANASRSKAAGMTAWSASAQGRTTPIKPQARPVVNTPPARSLGGPFPRMVPAVASPILKSNAPSRADFPDLPASAEYEARAAAKRSVLGTANGMGGVTGQWGPPPARSVVPSNLDGPLLLDGEIPLSAKKKGKRKELLFTNATLYR